MPCMPVTPVAWVDVNKKHIIDGAPALTEDSKLACFHGGVITIVPLDAGNAEEGTMNEIVESAVEKIGLALGMAGAIAAGLEVISPRGLMRISGLKGAKGIKRGGNKGKGGGKAGASNPSWGSSQRLAESAQAPAKGNNTAVGRAFQKHATREGTAFKGEITGNATKNTEQGMKYLNDILNNPNATYTIRDTNAYGKVLDVRLSDGMGARWSADGKTFIGFLERYSKK